MSSSFRPGTLSTSPVSNNHINSASTLSFRLHYQDFVKEAPVRPAAEMGLAYNIYLDSNKIYGCKNCKTHLANHDDIISRVPQLSPMG